MMNNLNPQDVGSICEPCMHQERSAGTHLIGPVIIDLGNIAVGAAEVARLLQKSHELRVLRDSLTRGEIVEQEIDAPLSGESEYRLHRALEALLHSAQCTVERLESESRRTEGETA